MFNLTSSSAEFVKSSPKSAQDISEGTAKVVQR